MLTPIVQIAAPSRPCQLQHVSNNKSELGWTPMDSSVPRVAPNAQRPGPKKDTSNGGQRDGSPIVDALQELIKVCHHTTIAPISMFFQSPSQSLTLLGSQSPHASLTASSSPGKTLWVTVSSVGWPQSSRRTRRGADESNPTHVAVERRALPPH
jgi:hypothetical protein